MSDGCGHTFPSSPSFQSPPMLSDSEARAYEAWEDTIRADMVVARIHDSKAVDTGTTVFVGEQVVLDNLRRKFPIFPMPFNKLARKTTFIAKAPGMGLGMFAARKLQVGDTVLRERPLLFAPNLGGDERLRIPVHHSDHPWLLLQAINTHVLPRAMDEMSETNRQAYSRLSKNSPYHSSPPEGQDIYSNIDVFTTNSFGVERPTVSRYKEYCVVPRDASRINHSCSPNAAWTFDESTFTFIVRATRNIPDGGQIFVTYCDLGFPRSIRQAMLWQYGITFCICKGCCPRNQLDSDVCRTVLGAFPSSPGGFQAAKYRALARLPRKDAFKVFLRLEEDIKTEGVELMPAYPIVLYTIGHFWRDIGQERKARKAERKADIYFDLLGDASTAASFKNQVAAEMLILDSPPFFPVQAFLNFLPRLAILLTVFTAMFFVYVV